MGDYVGYLAGALVIAAFSMREILQLRLVAMASNIAFVAYGWMESLQPILILHGILFPINLYRLLETYPPDVQWRADVLLRGQTYRTRAWQADAQDRARRQGVEPALVAQAADRIKDGA